jgi:hypothetical protein
VTALFADIRGSTETDEDLDSEEAHAVVDPVLRIMVRREKEGFDELLAAVQVAERYDLAIMSSKA